jgi:hypothetical protein
MSDAKSQDGGGLTRLSFIKTTAGVAAAVGVSAVGVPGIAAGRPAEEPGVPSDPTSTNPPEPVVAYVRDDQLGEVTVMRGTSETTYRDRTLVKRLLAAAPQETSRKGGK